MCAERSLSRFQMDLAIKKNKKYDLVDECVIYLFLYIVSTIYDKLLFINVHARSIKYLTRA